MKRKGFTLIELLAVIVILAIIALIATPIVMNTIEKSKKGAAERSTENYLKQVETAVAESLVDGSKLEDGVYTVDSETGKITNGYKNYDINTNGTKPTEGTIYIKNGEVVDGSYLKMDNNIVNFVDGKSEIKDYSAKTHDNTYIQNQGMETGKNHPIKYDPVIGDKCTSGTTCYDWYILEDKGSDYASVSLIMDRNLLYNVAWANTVDYLAAGGASLSDTSSCKNFGRCSNNTLGPVTANKVLKENTQNWKINAYLPSKDQIANAYTGTMPTWLIYYNSGHGNNYNFWTSTSSPRYEGNAYVVTDVGSIDDGVFEIQIGRNIRPAITILKSQL